MADTFVPFILPNVYTSPAGFDGYKSIVTGSCFFLGLLAENTSASTRWIQVFDGYQQPTNGQVPLVSLKALTVSQLSFNPPGPVGMKMSKGLTIVESSTGPTYTNPSETAMFLTVFWV